MTSPTQDTRPPQTEEREVQSRTGTCASQNNEREIFFMSDYVADNPVLKRLHLAQDSYLRGAAALRGLQEAHDTFLSAVATHCDNAQWVEDARAACDQGVDELERILGDFQAELEALAAKAEEVAA